MQRHFMLLYKGEDEKYKVRRLTDLGISDESVPDEINFDVTLPDGIDPSTVYYALYQSATELEVNDDFYRNCLVYCCYTGSNDMPAWKFFGPNGAPDIKDLFGILLKRVSELEQNKPAENQN